MGPTDGRTDGHDLLQRCVVASKSKGDGIYGGENDEVDDEDNNDD